MWRSFHFDKRNVTLDSYVIHIRQVTTVLGYGKPQVLDVFKNTLPTRFYWVLFPIEDLTLAVETAKSILTKEKIDRQLAGQSSLTPFMNIKDGYNSKKVTFDMQDSLDDKIDKLTSMVSKLTAQDGNQNKQFKSKYTKVNREDNQEFFLIEIVMIRELINIDIDQIVEIEGYHTEVEVSIAEL